MIYAIFFFDLFSQRNTIQRKREIMEGTNYSEKGELLKTNSVRSLKGQLTKNKLTFPYLFSG